MVKIQPFKFRRRVSSLWRRSIDGFTLSELLIVIVITGVVFISFSQSLISHIRSSATLEAMLRSQDKWMRLQTFLDIEISEAEQISVTPGVITLTGHCPDKTETTIYQFINGTLKRTGPNINEADGRLLCGNTSSGVVLMNNIEFSANEVDNCGDKSCTVNIAININDPSGYQFKAAKNFSVTGRSHSLD